MSKKISKEMDERLKKTFDDFDKDGDGKIDEKDLAQLLKKWNISVTDIELKDILNELDSDRNGQIDFKEFKNFMTAGGISNNQQLRSTFKLFDENGDGFIDAKELKQTLANLGNKLSDAQIEAIMKEADMDKDGKVSFAEFCKYFAKIDKKS